MIFDYLDDSLIGSDGDVKQAFRLPSRLLDPIEFVVVVSQPHIEVVHPIASGNFPGDATEMDDPGAAFACAWTRVALLGIVPPGRAASCLSPRRVLTP